MRSAITRLRRADSGIAAIEFGMIAPLMIILFLGCIEISQAVAVKRRLEKVSSATADLFTRPQDGDCVTKAEGAGHFLIANELMRPYSLTDLDITVLSVVATAGGNVVGWSLDRAGGSPYSAGAAYGGGTPGITLDVGESVIIAEGAYKYAPIVYLEGLPKLFTFASRYYVKPRNAYSISLKDGTC